MTLDAWRIRLSPSLSHDDRHSVENNLKTHL